MAPLVLGPVIIPELTPATLLLLASGLGQAMGVLGELKGSNMPYSKFAAGSKMLKQAIPSRTGMLIIYSLGLLAGVAGAALTAPPGLLASGELLPLLLGAEQRALLVSLLLALLFAKRQAEVLLVHRYSGATDLATSCTIAVGYGLSAALIIWQTAGLPPSVFADGAATLPAALLAAFGGPPSAGGAEALPLWPVAGSVLALTGMAGNLYHHVLLRNLRKPGAKEYRVPSGGLFDLVVCPQYTFEILAWLGIALTSQHLYAYIVCASMAVYLTGRAYATRQWYTEKFDTFPSGRKLLLPLLL